MKLQLFAALTLIVLLVAACSSEAPSKSTQTFTSQDAEAQNSQGAQPSIEKQKSTETKNEVPVELKLKVGETGKTSKVEVTVLTAKKAASYEYYNEFTGNNVKEATPGKVFIIAEADIKNVGSESIFVGSTQFSATDSEGYSYNPELYYGQSTDGLDYGKELYANQKMKGKMVFEVPEESTELKILYDFGNFFIETKLASWSLG